MKITETGTYKKTVEHPNPTTEELYWWYSGTHAGFNPNNPYAPKRATMTRTIIKLSPDNQTGGKE